MRDKLVNESRSTVAAYVASPQYEDEFMRWREISERRIIGGRCDYSIYHLPSPALRPPCRIPDIGKCGTAWRITHGTLTPMMICFGKCYIGRFKGGGVEFSSSAFVSLIKIIHCFRQSRDAATNSSPPKATRCSSFFFETRRTHVSVQPNVNTTALRQTSLV